MKVLSRLACLAVVAIIALSGATHAADYVWQGVNTGALATHTSGDSEPKDLSPYVNANTVSTNGLDLWDQGSVPGATDTADFYWNTSDQTVWGGDDEGSGEYPAVIDGAFDVAHLKVRTSSYNHPTRGTDAQLEIRKDLSVEDVSMAFGWSSAAQGENNIQITQGYTLSMTGTNPIALGGSRGGWGGFIIDGSLKFDAAGTQTLDAFNYGTYAKSTGTVEFANSSGTIILGDPGLSTRANMYLGQDVSLKVHPGCAISNEIGTGYVRLLTKANKYMVESIGGGTLTEAGGLALRFDRGEMDNYDVFLPAGTYQGFHFYNDRHYTRTIDVVLDGDVTLTGGAVSAGNGTDVATSQTVYSVYLQNNRAMRTRCYTGGYNLDMARGMRLTSSGPANAAANAYSRFYAEDGSTVTIGGDLLIESTAYLPGNTNGSGVLDETRSVGVSCASNVTITLHGDYITNVRSLNATGLSEAILNLVSDAGATNAFEVAADADDTVTSGTYGIMELNVGTDAESATIRLVNDYLNDNDATNVAKTKDGEVLLVSNLSIGAESALDCNGEAVKVTGSLSIDDDGDLDLASGLTLAKDDQVTSFAGVGDQTITWSTFKLRVTDSSNDGFVFEPVYNSGDDMTYWSAIPPPSGTLILVN